MKTKTLRAVGLVCGVVLLTLAPQTPSMAQTAEELATQYRREAMEQALQTRESFNLYGLHFDFDKATIQPASKSLLDDIATALQKLSRLATADRRPYRLDWRSGVEQTPFGGTRERRQGGPRGAGSRGSKARYRGRRGDPAGRQQRFVAGPGSQPPS